MKDKIIEILEDLESDVQEMRESGENDLRSVLHYISSAKYEVRKLFKENEN